VRPPVRLALTLAIFAATVALVVLKPGGRSEAIWSALGAGALLALGLVSPAEAVEITRSGTGALLFLAALLPLSALVEASGFFAWAAVQAVRRARGDGRALYRNVFLLGAAVTIALSLDTTAVMLTPLVLVFVTRLRLPARPYVLACAFVANTGSLLLPISNLTNLLFVEAFDVGFARFAARMVLPQLAALAVTYALCRWAFRAELPARFDPSLLGSPAEAVGHRGYFRASAAVLGLVFAGYFVAPLVGVRPYAVAFAGAAALLGYGLATRRVALRLLLGLPWDLFPFVIGLFVVVRGVENLGVASVAAGWLRHHAGQPLRELVVSATGTALAANAMNNLPAALLARSAIAGAGAGEAARFGALLGADIGPNVVPFASLATMLVLSVARKKGQPVAGMEVLKAGIWMTPLVLAAAVLALGLTFVICP
jgi:arsenical pump membrane protein